MLTDRRPAVQAAPGQNEGLKRDKTLVSFHKFTTERLSEPQLSADQFQLTSLWKSVIVIIIIVIINLDS